MQLEQISSTCLSSNLHSKAEGSRLSKIKLLLSSSHSADLTLLLCILEPLPSLPLS